MKEKKNTKPRRRYDSEFKENALQMIENGRSVPSVSQALGVSEGLLYTWKSKAKKKKNLVNTGEEDELKALRKRMKELEQERDILKKALSIFSRST